LALEQSKPAFPNRDLSYPILQYAACLKSLICFQGWPPQPLFRSASKLIARHPYNFSASLTKSFATEEAPNIGLADLRTSQSSAIIDCCSTNRQLYFCDAKTASDCFRAKQDPAMAAADYYRTNAHRRGILGHVSFGVRSYEISKKFYTAVFKPFGIELVFDDHARKILGYGLDAQHEVFNIFERGDDSQPPSVGTHFAFNAPSRACVDEFFMAGISKWREEQWRTWNSEELWGELLCCVSCRPRWFSVGSCFSGSRIDPPLTLKRGMSTRIGCFNTFRHLIDSMLCSAHPGKGELMLSARDRLA